MFDKLILSRRRYGATYRQERQRDKTRQPKAAAIEEIDEYQVDFDPDVYERSLSIEDPMGSFQAFFFSFSDASARRQVLVASRRFTVAAKDNYNVSNATKGAAFGLFGISHNGKL
jgi:hypothetical protein